VERPAGRGGGAGVIHLEPAEHLHQERLGEPLNQTSTFRAPRGLAAAAASVADGGGGCSRFFLHGVLHCSSPFAFGHGVWTLDRRIAVLRICDRERFPGFATDNWSPQSTSL
jgi:hypothetical protein